MACPKYPYSLSLRIIQASYGLEPAMVWIDTMVIHLKNYKNESSPNSLASNDIKVIYNDDQTGDLWIGTNDGLSYYRSALDDFENFKNDQNAHSLSSIEVLSIFIDSKKRIWVGTSSGLNLFDKKTGKFLRYMYSNVPSDQFYKRSIDAIMQDKESQANKPVTSY